jgi:hypothetical protein
MKPVSDAARPRRFFLFAALLFLAGWAIVAVPALGDAWTRNRQAVELNRELAGVATPLISEPGVPAAPVGAAYYRQLGHRQLAAGDREQAGRAFATAGWRAADFVAMATHFTTSDPARELDWLALAIAADNDPWIRAQLGHACRWDWDGDPACRRFLEKNQGNYFVNPDFAVADLNGWQQVNAPATYATGPCPDRDTLCAMIEVEQAEVRPAAGLGQCFQVTAGEVYRFAARLKVTTEGVWRPLYIQGTRDGQTDGHWLGDERGASDWRLWEYSFTAPAFDDGRACFYPVRLQASGQAWFDSVKVVALTEQK